MRPQQHPCDYCGSRGEINAEPLALTLVERALVLQLRAVSPGETFRIVPAADKLDGLFAEVRREMGFMLAKGPLPSADDLRADCEAHARNANVLASRNFALTTARLALFAIEQGAVE